jgi:hypothetical protein
MIRTQIEQTLMSIITGAQLFKLALNWSEVWALLIPLLILLFVKRQQPPFLKPVINYLWLALILNLSADAIADFKIYLPAWLQSNNFLYNVHSVVRFLCFSYFFIFYRNSGRISLKKILPVLFIAFLIINFSLYENFVNQQHLSGSLLAIESYLLLVYCMHYYLLQLQNEVENWASAKDFWIVTGLSAYVVINFFIFLFYVPMIKESPFLAGKMWDIHNIAYIFFCILIAKAFYVPSSN